MKKVLLLPFALLISIFAIGQSAGLDTYVNAVQVDGVITLSKSSRISMKLDAPKTDQAGYVYEFGEVLLQYEDPATGVSMSKTLLESQIQNGPTLTFALRPDVLEGVPQNARLELTYIKRYDRDKNVESFEIPLEDRVLQIHP
jgi:hypothetical protein